MADSTKGRIVMGPAGLRAAGVICLVAAGILWAVLFFKDGFSVRGIFSPILFTVLGVFWLFVGSRTGRPGESSNSDGGVDT